MLSKSQKKLYLQYMYICGGITIKKRFIQQNPQYVI